MPPDFLPPASTTVREGIFLKRGLPSGRMLTIHLKWLGQHKTWTFEPKPETWTPLDRDFVRFYMMTEVKMKLDRCYDILEPGWVKHRLAAWKAAHPKDAVETEPDAVPAPLVPLTDDLCRWLLPRAA